MSAKPAVIITLLKLHLQESGSTVATVPRVMVQTL
jgi:hypothetical protein